LECKNIVIEKLIQILTPFWEKRKNFVENPDMVWDILEKGNTKAREVAQQTMEEVRTALGF
jgi:tryptophanyl-tRNA synthetase